MQLPPQLSHARATPNPNSAGGTLQRPLFVRLAASFGGAQGWQGDGLRPLMLRTQYRVHPAISRLASELFYGGRLRDGVTAQVM
jgi:superfamily I DNA and/or RNA helicase